MTAPVSLPCPPTDALARPGAASQEIELLIGLDVGSTTAKAVVVDAATDAVLWQDYQRHETRQVEKVGELLAAVEARFPDTPRAGVRLFVTGSGGAALLRHIGGRFVQEVNAVTLAVEKLHPEVMSVVELGGQDAKIIVFKHTEHGKRKLPTMNDKCAGGTGAVIDKIAAKLKLAPEVLGSLGYDGLTLHPVAGKCGVFAETDINSLQKQGVPVAELMASLFDAIVQQNLSVLTRGNTLAPTVLLLGGPNTFLPGLRQCWQHHLPLLWEERGVALPDPDTPARDTIVTPANAQYFAALGAVEFGRAELEDQPQAGTYRGLDDLRHYLAHGRAKEKAACGGGALARDAQELAEFKERYRMPDWAPAQFAPGARVQAFVGVDGGSTSTKAVLLGGDGTVLAKAYQLSRGNPIEDTIEILGALERQVTHARLEILGVATTGYAKDILKDVLGADVALVETVAHTQACVHFYPGADVIVDVGGQDIKLVMLKDGRVKDFRLNTQCSAGNGYFLQATAAAFGHEVGEYAELAFAAQTMPEFGYGCAVFMQSDIVDFQRQGWAPHEIMAGLAAVLPKNIWLYVAQMPNLPALGRRFVLQGGTQHNLAAVKAQVDFIRARFKGSGVEPEVTVHRHCGESGAIGCALEVRRRWAEQPQPTRFIGFERVRAIRYTTTHNEDTRCHFCKNQCVRTFIDVQRSSPAAESAAGAAAAPGASPLGGVPRGESAASTAAAAAAPGASPLGGVPRGESAASTAAAGAAQAVPDDGARPPKAGRHASRVPLAPGAQRLIVATCEKGAVENVVDMRRIKAGLDDVMERNPNHAEFAARAMFREPQVDNAAEPAPKFRLPGAAGRRRALQERRATVRIGIPRVLNMYAQAPFFIGYFTSLGVPFRNLVFSDTTDAEMYRSGARRGAIDPCYPSKLGIPHVHNLLTRHHAKRPLTHLFFPMIDSLPTFLEHTLGQHSCPTVVATAEATHAAFIKEGDLFREQGIVFKKTFVNLDQPALAARQLYDDWKDELGLTDEESLRAVQQGLRATKECYAQLRSRARQSLDVIESEGRIGVVVLSRPYHNDPGVNHEILAELQKHGYPIFWQDTLPLDSDLLDRLFGAELRAGFVASPLSIDDVWKNSYSEHSSRKIWAAKYAARHPNLVALELSSFKCGHDAPIYSVVERIVESSGTPYFCFKDIDENRPTGSIRIRVETIVYFLERYRERIVAAPGNQQAWPPQGRLPAWCDGAQRQGCTDEPAAMTASAALDV